MAGIVAAIELVRAGRDVAVLESGAVGAGATARSVGIISSAAAGAGFGDPDEVVHGRPRAAWHGERIDEERFLLDLLDESGTDVGLTRGVLVLAPTRRNFKALADTVASRNVLYGTSARMLDGSGLRAESGGDLHRLFPGGLLLPESHQLDPGRMIGALASLARTLGVAICERAHVRALREDREGVLVVTEAGDIRARDALVTTGGYTDDAWPYLRQRVVGVPSVAAASAELPETAVGEMFPAGRAVLINRFRTYLCRPTPDRRRIVLAGPVAVAPKSPGVDAAHLRRFFTRLYPALSEIPMTHCWHGMIAATVDGRGHVGRRRRTWYSVGASGIVASAAAGRRAAAGIVSGDAPADPVFRPWPLRSRPRVLWRGIAASTRLLDIVGRGRLR